MNKIQKLFRCINHDHMKNLNFALIYDNYYDIRNSDT